METSGGTGSSSAAWTALAALLVAAATFVVFSPGLKGEFIGWDDQFYVLENPFITPLTAPTIGAMFSQFYFKSYTPLTLLSHAVDYRIWGLDPRGHHLVSLLLHSANAVWMFLIGLMLFRAAGRERRYGVLLLGSVVAALLFACHPLRVESVVCVSSRKDLLSSFFAFPSLMAYMAYAARREAPSARVWYGLTLLLFFLALLAKGSVMVLPGAFLLVDCIRERGIPRDRQRVWALVKEKIPFGLLAISAAYVAYRASEMAVPNQAVRAQLHQFRPLMVVYNLGFYPYKSLWPFDLAAIYDPPNLEGVVLMGGLAVVVTIIGVALLRRGRFAVPLAWASYLVLISPMAGIVPASIQIIANRYAYSATIGLALLGGWGVLSLWSRSSLAVYRPLILGCVAAALILLGAVAARSVGIWHDGESVWRNTIQVSPRSPVANTQMGFALEEKGDYPGALAHFYRALELYPEYPEGYCNLGGLFTLTGDTANAEWAMARALTLAPGSHFVYTNLGNVRMLEKRTDEAIALYRKALELQPGDFVSAYDLGYAFMADGKYGEAAAALRRSLRANPNYRDAWYLLGVVLGRHLNDREGSLEALRMGARLGHGEAQRALIGMGADW